MATDAELARRTDEIPAWKQAEIDELANFLDTYDSVGVVNFLGIPSRQLQEMRRDLHGSAELRISRNTLLTLALEEADENFSDLIPHVSGQVGLVGTNDNPFGLYRQLEESKTPAPINAGEIAPNDIVIDAGDTGMDPGPFVGELQQVGAEARIDEGSIKVTADSTVAETGETVSAQLANVLSELEIEPKEVGLDLRAVYADGILFEPEELAIDIEEYRADVQAAVSRAQTLSVEVGYPTAQTAPMILARASATAKSVGLAASIEDPALVPELVSKADAQVRQLASQIDDPDALPDAIQEIADQEPVSSEPEEADEDESTPEDDAAADDDDDADDDDEDGAANLGAMFG